MHMNPSKAKIACGTWISVRKNQTSLSINLHSFLEIVFNGKFTLKHAKRLHVSCKSSNWSLYSENWHLDGLFHATTISHLCTYMFIFAAVYVFHKITTCNYTFRMMEIVESNREKNTTHRCTFYVTSHFFRMVIKIRSIVVI